MAPVAKADKLISQEQKKPGNLPQASIDQPAVGPKSNEPVVQPIRISSNKAENRPLDQVHKVVSNSGSKVPNKPEQVRKSGRISKDSSRAHRNDKHPRHIPNFDATSE